MSKATYPLKLPLSIKKAAQRLAKEDGVSLNQWIAVAVAEKVGVVETAAEFFKKRAGKATGAGLMKFLRNAPDVPPSPKMNSQAVRLPKQFRLKSEEVKIFRRGDEIILREKDGTMVRAFDLLASLPDDLEFVGREKKDQPQKRKGL
jgi:virulence-associated protein VagC